MPEYKFFTQRHLDMALRISEMRSTSRWLPWPSGPGARTSRCRMPSAQRDGPRADDWRQVGRPVRLRLVPLHRRGARRGGRTAGGAAARRQRRDVRVRRDGVPVRGLTTVGSEFDYSLGQPGKWVPRVADGAAAASRSTSGPTPAATICSAAAWQRDDQGGAVAICDEIRALFYDFEVLLDFLKVLPEDSPRYHQILTGLSATSCTALRGIPQSGSAGARDPGAAAGAARRRPSLRISAVGHAHMDLAWLWPIRETIRKGARTFSTALALMDRYPDYVFGASQPQYFQWMKERYPALYAKIKPAVAEGPARAPGRDVGRGRHERLRAARRWCARSCRASASSARSSASTCKLPLAARRVRLQRPRAADPEAGGRRLSSRPRSCRGA